MCDGCGGGDVYVWSDYDDEPKKKNINMGSSINYVDYLTNKLGTCMTYSDRLSNHLDNYGREIPSVPPEDREQLYGVPHLTETEDIMIYEIGEKITLIKDAFNNRQKYELQSDTSELYRDYNKTYATIGSIIEYLEQVRLYGWKFFEQRYELSQLFKDINILSEKAKTHESNYIYKYKDFGGLIVDKIHKKLVNLYVKSVSASLMIDPDIARQKIIDFMKYIPKFEDFIKEEKTDNSIDWSAMEKDRWKETVDRWKETVTEKQESFDVNKIDEILKKDVLEEHDTEILKKYVNEG